jgi:hypothetical protein
MLCYPWIEDLGSVRLSENMRWLEQSLNQSEREEEGVPSQLKDLITANIGEFGWSMKSVPIARNLTDPGTA